MRLMLAVRSRGAQARAILTLLRPRQWIKNGFVLAPLVFSGEFIDPGSILAAFAAMLLFCLASSAAYVLNDIRDLEQDRHHPIKARSRPLAAGTLPMSTAIATLTALVVAVGAGLLALPVLAPVILAYLVMNLAYTFVLKHQPIADIFTIAVGFVLRVYAGAVILDVPVSDWMFVTTLCLALYLAVMKRRQEIKHSGTDGRHVLGRYSPALIDRYAEIAGTSALVFYSLFVMSDMPGMILTVPLVLFGLFRYWYVVEMHDEGESPTDALLSDWPLSLTVALWLAVTIWALWPSGV